MELFKFHIDLFGFFLDVARGNDGGLTSALKTDPDPVSELLAHMAGFLIINAG